MLNSGLFCALCGAAALLGGCQASNTEQPAHILGNSAAITPTEPVTLTGAVAPTAASAPVEPTEAAEASPHEEHVHASGQLGPGKGTLLLTIQPPAGAKLTEGAPLVLEGSGEHVRFLEKVSKRLKVAELPLRMPIEVLDGATEPVALNLKYYWCTEGAGAACRPERVKLLVDLDFSGDAAGGEALVSHQPRIN